MSTRSVLIFDRDRHNGSTLRDLLATWGYRPVVTDDIPAALQTLSELKPTFVVDGGSGEDAFVTHVRAYDEHLPVVLLEKPIDPNKLRLMIERALELETARRENELLR